MEVLINNQQKKVRFSHPRLRKIAVEIMDFLDLPENSELSLVLCDDDFIQKLSQDYLGKNRPTDVLSFPIDESEFESEIRLLGDVVISVETACRQAEKLGHPVGLEVVFLLVHGLLHLAGFDHSSKRLLNAMREQEEAICARLCEKKLLKGIESRKRSSLIGRSLEQPDDD